MTPNDLLTKKDLEDFKQELFALLGAQKNQSEWLKNKDVSKLLGISVASVQGLREKGLLVFSKVGGTYLYKREDIDKLLAEKKTPGQR